MILATQIVLISVLSGILYRIGGSNLNLPLKTKFRDWGCALLSCFAMYLIGVPYTWYLYLTYFILMWGSLSTYWDKWGTDDVEWYEWALTGFIYGMTAIVFFQYIPIHQIILRSLLLAILIPLSNKFQFKILTDKTDGVEVFRGIVIILTMLLLK